MRRALVTLAAVGLAGMVLACGDSTGPDRSKAVTLTRSELSPVEVGLNDFNRTTAYCTFTVRARVAREVTVQGARLRFFLNADRTSEFDSGIIPAEELAGAWDRALEKGKTSQSSWQVYATVPFVATFELLYADGEGTDLVSNALEIPCQPAIPPAADPPTITSVTITPDSGKIHNLDQAELHYVGTAPAGLWQGLVQISGACSETFTAGVALDKVIDYAPIWSPGNFCTPGDTVRIAVTFMDLALRTVSMNLTTQLVVVPPGGAPPPPGRGKRASIERPGVSARPAGGGRSVPR